LAGRLTAFLDPLGDAGGLSGRLIGWQLDLATIAANPFGLGLATAGGIAGSQYVSNPGGSITDNYFLKLAIELGPIGLGCFVGLIWSIFPLAWRNERSGWGLGAIAGITLACVLNNVLELGPTAQYFWVIAGIATAVTQASAIKSDRLVGLGLGRQLPSFANRNEWRW
jgi:hypothetical protein